MDRLIEIRKADPEIAAMIDKEADRQLQNIELIASENFVSKAVMDAMGTVFTNKYAEGYPGKRYYGGCVYADEVENLAIARAKQLFDAQHANVQPHSGAQANMAVYFAALNPGDTILGMNLAHGGHLTHGSPVNMSGKYFNIVPYGVKEDGWIDYEELRTLAMTHKPKLIVAGASAYPRKIDFAKFAEIAKEAGALFMVDMAHIAGLVAAGLHQNPVAYADFVTTTTHKTLRGPRGGMILCKEEHAKKINSAVFPGQQGGPLMHIIAAKAICFKEALADEFKVYQNQIIKNAEALATSLTDLGMKLVSGGTDTHLMLVDLTNLEPEVTGKDAQHMLDEVKITTNKNGIPFDTRSPFVTSGIRLGTPAVTTRGMKEQEMQMIAGWIYDVLTDFEASHVRVKEQVNELCEKFPAYF